MASFYQPVGPGGPLLANYTHFDISWNAVLSKEELTEHWYQWLVLAVGSCALVIGWGNFIFRYLRGRHLTGKESLWRKFARLVGSLFSTSNGPKRVNGPYQVVGEKPSRTSVEEKEVDLSARLLNVKSFSVDDPPESAGSNKSGCDLYITQMAEGTMEEALNQRSTLYNSGEHGSWFSRISMISSKRWSSRPGSSIRPTSSSHPSFAEKPIRQSRSPTVDSSSLQIPNHDSIELPETRPHSKDHSRDTSVSGKDLMPLRFGALDLTLGLSNKLESPAECTSHINKLRILEGFDGIVLSYTKCDSATLVNNILQGLQQQEVPVILQGDPDSETLKGIDLRLASGLIVENAAIFPCGRRRDFFEAARLRDIVARCKRQRKTRPGFFLGFFEVWDQRPHASTLRRAYKLADFFGAVVEAKPRIQDQQQTPPRGQCLSAFDWLKKAEIVKLQKTWAQPTCVPLTVTNPFQDDTDKKDLDLATITGTIPLADDLLSMEPLPARLSALRQEKPSIVEVPDYVSKAPQRADFWNTSSCGATLCSLGCYDLREEITYEQYHKVLGVQIDLQEHRMLHTPTNVELLRICENLKKVVENSAFPDLLAQLLTDLESGDVRIHKGLDSGFTLPDDGGHLWGVSDATALDDLCTLDIYISLKNSSDAATIWHTYLAHHGIPRLDRLEEELLLTQAEKPGCQLPKSIQQELLQSTDAELLYLMEQLRISGVRHEFVNPILQTCTNILIKQSTQDTWNHLHSKECLQSASSIKSILEMRLEHHARSGVSELPRIENLLQFYELLERKLEFTLFMSDRISLTSLSNVLTDAYSGEAQATPAADLYGLLFFCALRRLAFEDVYLETTDRCPLFLSQTDQAGVFAELWVLGSQCEIYFGIVPRTLGEIIYNRYRERLARHPPPPKAWNGKDVFTAYSTSEPSIKVEGHPVFSSGSGIFAEMPSDTPGWKADEPKTTMNIRKAASTLGAMSIFCLPAIIDVLLLTFLGRGFYLTVLMDPNVRIMANYAILTSLIMTGGVTGWVGSTGGFYLFSFAFDNMTHFLIQRFSAAFMLTGVVAFCGFFAFSVQYSWFDGFIFVLYLFALTIFLNVLGMLATMHRPGSPLTSGRTAMWKCLAILLISPIITTFVNGYDLIIYILVIYSFIAVLLITFRNICHEWTTWQTKVPTIKEKDLLAWYRKKTGGSLPVVNEKPAALAASARAALSQSILVYQDRSSFGSVFKSSKSEDLFVQKMAIGLPFALWLLEKESNGEALPERFTTTWFVQLELALGNQRQLTRGLKEHSSFITYRYSKYDLGQNVGLFLAALMDRLIDISMSARMPALDLYEDKRAKYANCFGLLYFLCGAVAVDIVLQHYWPFARVLSDEKITNLDQYKGIVRNEEGERRKRYRQALVRLLTFLFMIFGGTTLLMWAFVFHQEHVITYFASVSAYTAVLIFQFNRCFTKNARAHVITVFVAAIVGYIVGVTLRATPSTVTFYYNYAIGHNTACLLAAFGTFILTGYFKIPFLDQSNPESATSDQAGIDGKEQISEKRGLLAPHVKSNSCGSVHQSNHKILQHLCFNIKVETQWSGLPEAVRRLIVSRVLGLPARINSEVLNWLAEQPMSLSQHDESLKRCLEAFESKKGSGKATDETCLTDLELPELTSAYARKSPKYTIFGRTACYLIHATDVTVKWIALISGAAPDTNRELWYAMRNNKLRPVFLWILLKAWKLCWWTKNFFIYIFLIAGKRNLGRLSSLVRHGAPRTLRASTILVDTPRWQVSGFIARDQNSDLTVMTYDGLHTEPPEGKAPTAVAFYDSSHRLQRREVFGAAGTQPITTRYFYDDDMSQRWPSSKVTVESGLELKSQYDNHGRIVRGKLIRGKLQFDFEFLYRKRPKGNSEILKATYTSIEGASPISISVFWCVRPRVGSQAPKNWIPSDKIQRVIATMSGNTYDMKWTYKHARDPEIHTSFVDSEGKLVPCMAPAPILQDDFGFLTKPKHPSFDSEDLLIYHSLHWLQMAGRETSFTRSTVPGWFKAIASFLPVGLSYGGKKVIYRKLATSTLRTALWTCWGKAPYLDAVSACFLDELMLRKEPLLKTYWSLRDAGYLYQAADALDESLEMIVSTIEPSHESSQTCPLLIKSADLFTMGLGKDANQLTARLEDAYHDTQATTSVIFSDNGCWPDNPGGVSNCRRDLVNGHSTIRGHCLAESANDFGIPRYQIERNVNSLKVLPLWGLDGKTPYHGVLDNLLQTQVDEKINATKTQEDIKEVFVPLLTLFVRGARSKRYTRADLVSYSNVILKLSRYFERCDYNKTWNSDEVWQAWIEAWLHDYNDPNISSAREYFEIEQPSMKDLRSALDLYICYFFIYSVEAPANCPTVFQSTHHGISSLYGMLLKYRRGTTWGIWDHAILWRETCLNISPAQCLLPIPVQTMLLAGVKLACHLAYTHVDIVLPCTSVFNPDWEIDLGTDQGLRGSKKVFSRKIDPIVNGIGNMDAFQPVKETRSKLPTTVMLSNVQFIKDVKNAVLAADIIINTYGFSDYRLVIYGAQDRQPSYALETETIINTRGLAGKVILAGFGSPQEVLKDAWIFMNSSLSEGLPLAIGEAALSGVPIVATEVGATALVLTDPDDTTKRYGEVVPPNDPEALARAQLSILGMLGPWAEYTKDKNTAIPLPDKFAPEDVEWITARMYEKADDRRALGLKLRDVVLRSFHGHRYLREHEQMYWIQRRRAEIRREAWSTGKQVRCNLLVGEKNVFGYDNNADTEHDARPRWQEFDVKRLRGKGQSRPQKHAIGSSVNVAEIV